MATQPKMQEGMLKANIGTTTITWHITLQNEKNPKSAISIPPGKYIYKKNTNEDLQTEKGVKRIYSRKEDDVNDIIFMSSKQIEEEIYNKQIIEYHKLKKQYDDLLKQLPPSKRLTYHMEPI
eukprot:492697_1